MFFHLPASMLCLGTTEWFGVPASIWICLALYAVGVVVLGWTSFGRSLYAIGGNLDGPAGTGPVGAKAAGIRTDRVLWIFLVVGSVLAALAGSVD